MTLPGEVQKWQASQDGLENLTRSRGPMPKPGKDEVLVEIYTVSLNYRDTEGESGKQIFPFTPSELWAETQSFAIVAMGTYKHHKSVGEASSIVPCSDMCGVVVEIGEGTNPSPWHIGDRVLSTFNQTHLTGQITPKEMTSGLGLPLDGVLQTYRVFPVTGLVKTPDYLSDEEASTLPIAAVTAWMSINGTRPMGSPGGKGETILLQGTGGVAIAGLQIGHAAGAESECCHLVSAATIAWRLTGLQ